MCIEKLWLIDWLVLPCALVDWLICIFSVLQRACSLCRHLSSLWANDLIDWLVLYSVRWLINWFALYFSDLQRAVHCADSGQVYERKDQRRGGYHSASVAELKPSYSSSGSVFFLSVSVFRLCTLFCYFGFAHFR